jgi:Predicted acid phosphatase
MNTHALVDKYEPRTNPAGERYYWAAGHGLDFRVTDDGTDVRHLFDRAITITPLRFDLTDRRSIDAWRAHLEG